MYKENIIKQDDIYNLLQRSPEVGVVMVWVGVRACEGGYITRWCWKITQNLISGLHVYLYPNNLWCLNFRATTMFIVSERQWFYFATSKMIGVWVIGWA